MSERGLRSLKEFNCAFQSGFAFRSRDFCDTGIPIIKIGNIQNKRVTTLVSNSFFPESLVNKKIKDYCLSDGDVLIAMTGQGSVGRVGKLILNDTDRALLNQRVGKFICDEKTLNREYLFYILTSDIYQGYLFSTGTGSGQPNLSPDLILETEIPDISYREQEAIAAVLSSLDDKIDLLHRQNKTLEALAQTLFRHWFVDNAAEDWEEGTLGDVIEIYDRKRIPLSKMQRVEMKEGVLYPYYGAASIMDYVNDYIFDGEYILLGEDGTVRTDDGYPILQYATGKFWVNNHAHVFQAKEPFSNFFVWCYLRQKNINKIVTGAVQPKINQTNLKSLDFPLIPKNLIIQFNVSTEAIFDKIKSCKVQIGTLESLRDTLLPKLMSGEVQVRQ